MTNIAWRNLTGQRTRFAPSTGGVAFAVMLILIVNGLYDGILNQATDYARTVDADLWVSQASTPDNLIQAVSILPDDLADELERAPGVASASPVLTRATIFPLGDRDVALFLVGVDGPGAASWPRALPPHRSPICASRSSSRAATRSSTTTPGRNSTTCLHCSTARRRQRRAARETLSVAAHALDASSPARD